MSGVAVDEWSQVPVLEKEEVEQLESIQTQEQHGLQDHLCTENQGDELEQLPFDEALHKVFHSSTLSVQESSRLFVDQRKWLDSKVEKKEVHKSGLPNPERVLMVGINDQIAVAIVCPHAREMKLDNGERITVDAAKEIKTIYDALEDVMFSCAEMQSAHRLRDQIECKRKTGELLFLSQRDANLHQGCNRALKEVATRRQDVPMKLPKPTTAEEIQQQSMEITMPRPDDTLSSHSCNRFQLEPLPTQEHIAPEYNRMGTCFISVCVVPNAPENAKKPKVWTDAGISIPMPEGQVPAVSFNTTTNRLAVAYQRADIRDDSPYRYRCFIDIYQLDAKGTRVKERKPLHQFCFSFPTNIPLSGLLQCHLSDRNVVTICLGSCCIVIDSENTDECRILTFTHPGVNPETKPLVSCANVFYYQDDVAQENEKGFLVVGTQHGEAYHMNWTTGALVEYFLAPNVESVYQFHYASNKLLMQTISGVHIVPLVRNKEQDPASLFAPLSLPMIRPVASFLHGSQISVFSKYEQLFICSTIVRKVTRVWNELEHRKELASGRHQIAYAGIYATTTSIYLLHMDGFIRRIFIP